jgi:hypothetical protein
MLILLFLFFGWITPTFASISDLRGCWMYLTYSVANRTALEESGFCGSTGKYEANGLEKHITLIVDTCSLVDAQTKYIWFRDDKGSGAANIQSFTTFNQFNIHYCEAYCQSNWVGCFYSCVSKGVDLDQEWMVVHPIVL